MSCSVRNAIGAVLGLAALLVLPGCATLIASLALEGAPTHGGEPPAREAQVWRGAHGQLVVQVSTGFESSHPDYWGVWSPGDPSGGWRLCDGPLRLPPGAPAMAVSLERPVPGGCRFDCQRRLLSAYGLGGELLDETTLTGPSEGGRLSRTSVMCLFPLAILWDLATWPLQLLTLPAWGGLFVCGH